jgi:hypothetical protein
MLQVATVNLHRQRFSRGPVSSPPQQRFLSRQPCKDEEEEGVGVGKVGRPHPHNGRQSGHRAVGEEDAEAGEEGVAG